MEQNEVLEEFDRYVFESIVEKVIVGGIDEEGNKDPAQLTFVYKTGLKNSVDGDKFKPQRKNARGRHRTDKLCSNASDEVENMCSDCSDDTCGMRDVVAEEQPKVQTGFLCEIDFGYGRVL